tara:strand:- start:396 stop:635 length:240 start_codon:yes stop_codon:yes gene_type:complete
MPTYPVIHKETGEKKELSMTMKEYCKWKEENPEWDKDWQAGVSGVGEVGHWKNKMSKTHPGWNDIMTRASKIRNSTIEW